MSTYKVHMSTYKIHMSTAGCLGATPPSERFEGERILGKYGGCGGQRLLGALRKYIPPTVLFSRAFI